MIRFISLSNVGGVLFVTLKITGSYKYRINIELKDTNLRIVGEYITMKISEFATFLEYITTKNQELDTLKSIFLLKDNVNITNLKKLISKN